MALDELLSSPVTGTRHHDLENRAGLDHGWNYLLCVLHQIMVDACMSFDCLYHSIISL